ncbi:MAG: glutamate racemase [Dehalococcoidia bacterium]|nr:glutamate racemase [Dehalococcoidia bacterium]
MTKIGIFDSGVGGLTIASKIQERASKHKIIYYADNAFFPYGSKDEDIVIQRSIYLTKQLLSEGCNIIIVACNTASSAALELLRKQFDVPIIGIEPAVKPAMENTSSGKALLLATPLTTTGERLSRLEKNYVDQGQLYSLPMEGLAEKIELGLLSKDSLMSELQFILDEYYHLGVDALILGCTHYYFLKKYLSEISPAHILIFDSINGVIKRIEKIISEEMNSDQVEQVHENIDCYVTGNITSFMVSITSIIDYGFELPKLLIMKKNHIE